MDQEKCGADDSGRHDSGLNGNRSTYSLPSRNSDSSLSVQVRDERACHGAAKRPFESRLLNRHSPVPSQYSTFEVRRLLPTNTNSSPRKMSLPIARRTTAASVSNDLRMST